METTTSPNLDLQRLSWFIGISFGIAWLTALFLFLNGGLINSPVLIPNTPITLALVLLAVVYMFAPAIANALTRIITREGWKDVQLRPNFKKGKLYWLAAWVLPGLLTAIGGTLFFLIFPKYFDMSLSTLRRMVPPAVLETIPISLFALIMILQYIIISPILNGIFTFGEEFGWRAYLLQKLLPLGKVKAIILSGMIWGVWHAPVIAMGHNYGMSYPGYPWTGILGMILFCIAAGALLSWVVLEGKSVWPAAIGHGAMNGIAGTALLFTVNQPNPLIGPLPVGIIGMSGFIIFAAWLLIRYHYNDRKERPPFVGISQL